MEIIIGYLIIISGIVLLFIVFDIFIKINSIKSIYRKAKKKMTKRMIKKMYKRIKYFIVLVSNKNKKKTATLNKIRNLFIDNNNIQTKYTKKLEIRLDKGRNTKDCFLVVLKEILNYCLLFILISFTASTIYVLHLESYIDTFEISSRQNQKEIVQMNLDYYFDATFFQEKTIELNSNKFDSISAKKQYSVEPNKKYIISTYVSLDLNYDNMTKEEIEKDYTKYSCSGIKVNDETATLESYAIIKENSKNNKTIEKSDGFYKIRYYYESGSESLVSIEYFMGNGNNTIDYCSGKILYTEVVIEEINPDNKPWKILWAIFENSDINYTGKGGNYSLKFNMTNSEINEFKLSSKKFKTSMEELTNKELTMDIDIVQIKEPLTKLEDSKSTDVVYELNSEEVFEIVKKSRTNLEKYDHFFILIKIGNETNYVKDMPWAGYGGSEYAIDSYNNRGFSVIRLPDGDINVHYNWWLSTSDYEYPHNVYIHEFLHTMETTSSHYNLFMPQIHEYEKYGYKYTNNDSTVSEYSFLKDVIQNNVNYSNKKSGVNSILWKLRPSKFSIN